MNKRTEEKRVYFFDAMRSILIIFIVITHILQNFNPNASWLIHNNNDISIAPFIIDFLMLFTLQSFFIMSGYLAAMSIQKTGIKKFFDSRIKRVLIPIIFTALTFNSLQAYLLSQTGWLDLSLFSYVIEGKWISHLWFLIDLAIFFVLTYLSIFYFNSILKYLNHTFSVFFNKMGLYITLFFFSLLVLILIILFSILSPYIYNPIINISSIFFYFSFFILGTLLFINQKFFKKFIQIPIIIAFIITALSVFISLYFSESENNLEKIVYNFFNVASNIFASALCFTLFYKFFNKSSKIFIFLANASFSIYLFHHLIVISIGLVLIQYGIGGYLGFFILVIVTLLSTLLIHYFLISKISLLAFLYNGKKLKGKT